MECDPWPAAMLLARQQHGLITRKQLRELGVSRRTLTHRTSQSLLTRFGRELLVLPGTPDNLITRSRMLVLLYPEAVLTAQSAAALLGPGPWAGLQLDDRPCAVHPRRKFPAHFVSHPGVRTVSAHGVRVARPSDTIVDLLRFLRLPAARTLAYRAVQTAALSLGDLRRAIERLHGLNGVGQLRRLAQDLSTGAHSDLERRAHRLLHDAGIRGWIPNHPVLVAGHRFLIDIAFPEAGLAVELDGRAFHMDARRFQGDRTRQTDLLLAGWRVLRLTWEDVTARPEKVLTDIRAALGEPGTQRKSPVSTTARSAIRGPIQDNSS